MKIINKNIFLLLALFVATVSYSQKYWDRVKARPSSLDLEKGYDTLETPDFQLVLVKASQTVASLSPKSNKDFDFTPGERLEIRDKDTLYQLGDLNFRIRTNGGDWKSYSTSYHRSGVKKIENDRALAAADLGNLFPEDLPLSIKRFYEIDNGHLVLKFELKNKSDKEVEIGALGVPMVFNNILEGHSLEEAHAKNVFFDPYIGEDAGYLEVKKLDGAGPVLLVFPEENMPFEAYRPLLDDPTPRSIVFEGFHEWMTHSKAYAENEWKGVKEWNKPTSEILKPGETKTYSLKFVLSDSIRGINNTLLKYDRPVAVGVPGYVLPEDVKAQLFLKYSQPVDSISVFPKEAITIENNGKNDAGYDLYELQGKKWGRARVTVYYKNGLKQTINYKVTKPETEVVKDYGRFLTTKQWFNDEKDPFHRNPSVISYDYETKQQVTQDSRAWIAGLSDEGGAGSWLGAIMKELVLPNKEEISKLENFVDKTIWGGIQYDDGDHKYGVRKSIFYYEPEKMPEGTYSDTINYKTWAAWNKKGADDPGRSYNYPHVTAAYWVLYRLARYHEGLVTQKDWKWYISQAYHTAIAMNESAPYYAQFGQMEGSVFLYLLKDLKQEGLTDMADDLEAHTKKRADHWKSLAYPFGSEMPWDSTGQEEVYMWSDYFGYNEKAQVTLNAILAYMPTIPHWAYNGNARRYWDFLYGGKLSRIERQIHHYGSGLNAIPVLKEYRENPDDLYLLKVGYGGLLGSISNITQDGFGPAAFHSFPSTLDIDYLSGDYGSGFYGYAVNTSSYVVKSDDFGWLAFGGNLSEENNKVKVEITTAAKDKLFFQPKDLWITLEAGNIASMSYDKSSEELSITLMPKDEFTPNAFVKLSEGWKLDFPKERGAYKIPLQNKPIVVNLKKG